MVTHFYALRFEACFHHTGQTANIGGFPLGGFKVPMRKINLTLLSKEICDFEGTLVCVMNLGFGLTYKILIAEFEDFQIFCAQMLIKSGSNCLVFGPNRPISVNFALECSSNV